MSLILLLSSYGLSISRGTSWTENFIRGTDDRKRAWFYRWAGGNPQDSAELWIIPKLRLGRGVSIQIKCCKTLAEFIYRNRCRRFIAHYMYGREVSTPWRPQKLNLSCDNGDGGCGGRSESDWFGCLLETVNQWKWKFAPRLLGNEMCLLNNCQIR